MKKLKKYFILLVISIFSFIICFFIFNFTAIKNKISKTDMIKVTFYSKQNNNENIILEISDNKEIKKITNCFSIIPALFYKCGYDGKLELFKNGKLILNNSFEFNLSDDCKHIVFVYNNKIISKKLTKKGQILLTQYYEAVLK